MAESTCVVKHEPTFECTLKLNAWEFATLREILLNIGGSPKDSPRKYADDINNSLNRTLHELNLTDEDYNYLNTILNKVSCCSASSPFNFKNFKE